MKSLSNCFLFLTALLLSTAASPGQTISIQFAGAGTALAPTDLAGVDAAGYWNVETANSGSGITGLVDSNDMTVSNVTLQYSSAYNVAGPITSPSTPEETLYSSHIESPYSAGTTGPVDSSNRVAAYITNIPYSLYDVYVYTRNQGNAASVFASSLDFYTSNADIASNSVSQAYTDASNTSSYVLGDNYVEFTNLTSSNLFLLDSAADLNGGAGLNSGFAGIQIEAVTAVPEPPTWMALAAGSAILAVGYRRSLKTRRVRVA